MDLKEIGWECVDQIYVTYDRDQWQPVVNTVIVGREFLNIWQAVKEGVCPRELVAVFVICLLTYQKRQGKDLSVLLNKKVKCSHYRPGVAQRVGRGIALLFHDHGTRRG